MFPSLRLQFGKRVAMRAKFELPTSRLIPFGIHSRGCVEREREREMEYLEYFDTAGRMNEKNIFYTRCVLQFFNIYGRTV